jgi:hypothetical protein
MGVSSTTKTVESLRSAVLLIKSKLGALITLVQKYPECSINFSNGENLTSTPMLKYYFLLLIKYLLLYLRTFGSGD